MPGACHRAFFIIPYSGRRGYTFGYPFTIHTQIRETRTRKRKCFRLINFIGFLIARCTKVSSDLIMNNERIRDNIVSLLPEFTPPRATIFIGRVWREYHQKGLE